MLVTGNDDVRRFAGIRGQLELGLVVAPVRIVLDGLQIDAPVVAGLGQGRVGGAHGAHQVVAAPVLMGRGGLAAGNQLDQVPPNRDLNLNGLNNRLFDLNGLNDRFGFRCGPACGQHHREDDQQTQDAK